MYVSSSHILSVAVFCSNFWSVSQYRTVLSSEKRFELEFTIWVWVLNTNAWFISRVTVCSVNYDSNIG